MADGDKTGNLVSQIRDILQQHSDNQLFKNDYVFYNALDKYQQLFMVQYYTTREKYTITLVAGTDTYALSSRLFQITDISGDVDNSYDDYKGRYDKDSHSIIISDSENIVAGDKIYVEGFIKPSYDWGDSRASDRIDENTDPIIQEEYYPYLIDAVLSDYRKFNEAFPSLEYVKEQVRQLSKNLRKTERFPYDSNKYSTLQS